MAAKAAMPAFSLGVAMPGLVALAALAESEWVLVQEELSGTVL